MDFTKRSEKDSNVRKWTSPEFALFPNKIRVFRLSKHKRLKQYIKRLCMLGLWKIPQPQTGNDFNKFSLWV